MLAMSRNAKSLVQNAHNYKEVESLVQRAGGSDSVCACPSGLGAGVVVTALL